MRLLVDVSRVRFTVSKPPEEKRDLDGKSRGRTSARVSCCSRCSWLPSTTRVRRSSR